MAQLHGALARACAPNDRQLAGLARLYGAALAYLLAGRELDLGEADFAGMLLRAEGGIDQGSVPGINEFVQFLGRYAELSRLTGVPTRGLTQSQPLRPPVQVTQKDDARRKAEEVRAHLELGMGPLSDLDRVCEMLGVTASLAPLGGDLLQAPSGIFLNHPEAAFSILVNLDMTPGRQRFTIAHEIAQALFHSN